MNQPINILTYTRNHPHTPWNTHFVVDQQLSRKKENILLVN